MYVASDDQIALMYREGMSIRDIASALSVSKFYVEQSLIKQGVEKRTKREASLTPQALMRSGRTDPRTEQEIVELYRSGMSSPAIAERLNLSLATVLTILERHHVELRSRKIPSDVEDRMIEMYQSGSTLEQVGAAFGYTKTAVRLVMMRRGVDRRPIRPFGAGEAREGEGGGLVCMGRKVELVMKRGRDIKAKHPRDGMLYDGTGTYWPKCSLLITSFENGTKTSDESRGRDFFGRKTKVYEGRIDPGDLPPKSIDEWDEIGEVKTVFYDRAGKYEGPFRHEFNKPRGLWILLWPIKKGSDQPAILYKHGDSLRIELPEGCVVDDRGIVVP